LHKAVQNEQLLQVELLCIYGANPALPNNKGQTAEDVAREVAQKTGDDSIYERLVEIRHELPDRLTFFVARKRPNHRIGNHFVNLSCVEHVAHGRERLSNLPDEVFTELCADLFDEVDRREIETVWEANSGQKRSQQSFLPIHPEYSQSRNQGRQKIAKMLQPDIFQLLVDVIDEFRKRVDYDDFHDHESASEVKMIDDYDSEDPVYDDVASTSSQEEVLDVDNEIQEITSEKSDEVVELKKELETARNKINSLNDQNSIFRDRITAQAKELIRYRGKKAPSPSSQTDFPPTQSVPRSRSRSKVEVLCQGVSTSLKKLLTAVKNGQTELFRGCGDEIERCISDLIDLYEGDGSNAVTVLSNNRERLIESINNMSTEEENNELFSCAREIATNIKLLLQKDAS